MGAGLIALLILSTALPAGTDDLIDPPPLIEWPGDLPKARTVEGGTLYPDPLDRHISDRLLFLEDYPAKCKARLERLDKVRKAEAKKGIDTCEAVCRERLTAAAAESSSGFTVLEAIGIAAGALAVGVIAGAVVCFSAGL